jgi:hypothetical protein
LGKATAIKIELMIHIDPQMKFPRLKQTTKKEQRSELLTKCRLFAREQSMNYGDEKKKNIDICTSVSFCTDTTSRRASKHAEIAQTNSLDPATNFPYDKVLLLFCYCTQGQCKNLHRKVVYYFEREKFSHKKV